MLVNHLTSNYRSIHPGADMCSGNTDNLEAKSTIGSVKPGADGLFSKLPIPSGDSRLVSALNFKLSQSPAHDIMVVHVKGLSGAGVSPSKKGWVGRKLILSTEIAMGLIILCGTIFSALLGNIWAVVLFATYLFHWLASTAMSFCQLVIPDPDLKTRPDETTVFAVYSRPSGGLIIFKGTQSIMERWARTKWVFKHNTMSTFIHWNWILTGTAAALASVACMINMNGYLQLGFLGMLLYSSVAELWLTILANGLQTTTFHGTVSIIQVSLGLDQDHRLDKLRWIDLGLLPPMTVFQAMVSTLDYLNDLTASKSRGITSDIVEAKPTFDFACRDLKGIDFETRDGIWTEIQRVWEQRTRGSAPSPRVHQV